jgi:hypothetical protein
VLIFHQNMRAYGGASAVRTHALVTGLDGVSTRTGATYAAAGFTDLRSDGSGLRGSLESLALTLDPNLRDLVIVHVGTTAGGQPELVGIAWSEALVHVTRAGHVRYDPRNARGTPVVVDATAIPPNRVLPIAAAGMGPDARGFAYIAGARVGTGAPILIGFIHNLFALGTRSRCYSNLGRMAMAAAEAVGVPGAEVVLGGDFGLAPRAPNARGGVRLLARGARAGAGGSYVATTDEGTHDFWLVRDAAITDAQAGVYPETRVAHGSDHAAITILR